MEQNQTDEDATSKHHASIRAIHMRTFVFALGLSAIAIVTIVLTFSALNRLRDSYRHYQACSNAAEELMDASDELTSQARSYVTTGVVRHLNSYLDEIYQSQHRNEAVRTIENESEVGGAEAAEDLQGALKESNELSERELYAMRVAAEAYGLRPLPESILRTHISPEDEALSSEKKLELAKELVFGDEYDTIKSSIVSKVSECTNDLIKTLERREREQERGLATTLTVQGVIVAMLVGLVAYDTFMNNRLIIAPLNSMLGKIKENKPLDEEGSSELIQVISSYNQIYESNRKRTEHLKHEAETDALTGLFNRGTYDRLLAYHSEDVALLILDVDRFKDINDSFGHETGDAVLKKIANSLLVNFRASDYACRIGGDEFAVIMTGMEGVPRSVITDKLDSIAQVLRNTSDGLPEVSLSTGIALSNELETGYSLYHAADNALYKSKGKGRDCYTFFGA